MLALSKNDVLFHAATHETVAAVVSTSLLKTSKPHMLDSSQSRYISFARTLTGEYLQAVSARGSIAILRFDGKLLGQRYRLVPYNFNRVKSRQPGWAEAEERLLTNTAAVNISGCITSLLIIGESELLNTLAAEAGIPSESFASIRDVLLSRRNPSQQTNMTGGWRSPAAKAPRLPTKPEDWPDVDWQRVSDSLRVSSSEQAAQALTDIWLTRNLIVRAEAEDRLPVALNIHNARIVLPALRASFPKTKERIENAGTR